MTRTREGRWRDSRKSSIHPLGSHRSVQLTFSRALKQLNISPYEKYSVTLSADGEASGDVSVEKRPGIISDGTENRIRSEVRGKYEIAGVRGSKKGSVKACQGELVQHDSFRLTRPSFHTSVSREPSAVFEEGDWRVPK